MQIGWIKLLEFRNFRSLSYTPSPRLNVLIGPNGQGKTNLLESIAVLLTGRSFRTARIGELPHWGAGQATLTGDALRADASRPVSRAIRRLDGGGWQGRGAAVPWARVVAFGWHDLAILTGPPGARRNFIDGCAARLFSTHLATWRRYRQVLAARNRVLETRGGEGDLGARLAPWDEQLALAGMALVARRRRAVAALQTELARVHPALAGSRTKVEIRYRASVGEATEPADLLAALQGRRAEEVRRRQTLVGPHRDDLVIELDGIDARTFGSRGEQRLLALALRLAEVLPVGEATGTPPIVLLDDALSELDPAVRANVLRELGTAEQVFLTTPEPLEVPDAACWRVAAGRVEPLEGGRSAA